MIGAGPAGAAAALDLRRAGATVLIIERRSLARAKPCAGALTAKAVARLRYDLGPVARRWEAAVEFRYDGRFRRTARASSPVAAMTVRAELDALALGKATAAGADLVETGVAEIVEESGGVSVTTTDGLRLAARFVVGADGAASRTRRLVGGPPQAHALAIEGVVPNDRFPEPCGMMFDVAAVRGGYGWAFAKGDHVNVGLYVASDERPLSKGDLQSYARRAFGVDQVEHVVGHPLGVGRPTPWLGTDRVLLAGDAAGTAERLLGEGIHNALASGQAAAAAILAALRAGADARRAYRRAMTAVVEDVALCDATAETFYGWPRATYALLCMPPAHRGLARGFAAGATLREIASDHPATAWLARRARDRVGGVREAMPLPATTDPSSTMGPGLRADPHRG